MKFYIKKYDWNRNINEIFCFKRIDCMIIGFFEEDKWSDIAQIVNVISCGLIERILNCKDFTYEVGSFVFLYEIPNFFINRLLLVGLGKKKKINKNKYNNILYLIWKKIFNKKIVSVVFTLTELLSNCESIFCIKRSIVILRDLLYKFTKLKCTQRKYRFYLKYVYFSLNVCDIDKLKNIIIESVALSNGIDFSRNLSDLPSNFCTPNYLANASKILSENFKLNYNIFSKKKIKDIGMNAFLAVSQGSIKSPKFVVIYYFGVKKDVPPIVLVGKGITFDTGGVSLKSSDCMDEMKYDMCGASSILGTIYSISEINLDINVIGIIPICENILSSKSIKPGDIITSMKGLTIEILNTDAEGRLILCDALTYAENFNPSIVIDVATLTGSCLMALGNYYSGLFSKHDLLSKKLIEASKDSFDHIWRLPINIEYNDQLKSNFADISNVGGKFAGSITASCFLSYFTKSYLWAHIDIAGTAYNDNNDLFCSKKISTGRPVPLLFQFLINSLKK